MLAAPGQEVDLSAANSYDTDGEIASYRWDFNDSERARRHGRGQADLRRARHLHRPAHRHRRQQRRQRHRHRLRQDRASTTRRSPTPAPISFRAARRSPSTAPARSMPTAMPSPTPGISATGRPPRGPVVTHTYAEGGTYPVVLTRQRRHQARQRNAAASRSRSRSTGRRSRSPARTSSVCTGRHRRPRRQPLLRSGRRRAPLCLGPSATARRSDIVNPTKSYTKGGTYPRDADGAGRFRPAQRLQQLADRRRASTRAGGQRRQGHPRLRQDRGRLRRLRLERHRRRRQQLRLGFRRRQFRRRRHARPTSTRSRAPIASSSRSTAKRPASASDLDRRGRGQDHRRAGRRDLKAPDAVPVTDDGRLRRRGLVHEATARSSTGTGISATARAPTDPPPRIATPSRDATRSR